ncbi:MAG: glycoside hydrolase domain-containing protein [Promethearchaeota archaeon]
MNKFKIKVLGISLISGFLLIQFIIFDAVEVPASRTVPAIFKGSGYFIWQANSTQRVGANASVLCGPIVESEPVKLAREDTAITQIIITTEKVNQFQNITITSSEFIHSSNSSAIIPSTNWNFAIAEYTYEDYPDKLVPINATLGFDTNVSTHYAIWCTIHTFNDTWPGLYEGTFEFRSNNVPVLCNISMKVLVWNFTLPPPTQRYLRSCWCKLDLRDASYRADYLEHYITPGGIGNPYFIIENNTVTFNWSKIQNDENASWIDEFNKTLNEGIRSFGMGFGFGRRPWSENENQTVYNWYYEATKFLASRWFIDFDGINRTWLDLVYTYIWDEPGEGDYPTIIQQADIIHEAAHDALDDLGMNSSAMTFRVLLTEEPSEDYPDLWDAVDIWVPILDNYDKQRELCQWLRTQPTSSKLPGVRTQLWFYVCLYPSMAYPNIQLFNSLFEIRQVFGIIPFLESMDGILYWSNNYWVRRFEDLRPLPDTIGYGYNGYGDGWLVWPEERGVNPVPGQRWEIIREAIQDFLYLSMLNGTLQNLKTLSSNDQIAGKAVETWVHEIESIFQELKAGFSNLHEPSRDFSRQLKLLNEAGEILDAMPNSLISIHSSWRSDAA